MGWWTESKALEKSIARAAVREAGLRWLKPEATSVESGRRAVEVECMGRKPCWERLGGRAALRKGRARRSRILEAGHRREMGR